MVLKEALRKKMRNIYYMAIIISGEMANCDWMRSTFSGGLFSSNGPAVHYVKPNSGILNRVPTVLENPGKSLNLLKISRPGKSLETDKVLESPGIFFSVFWK